MTVPRSARRLLVAAAVLLAVQTFSGFVMAFCHLGHDPLHHAIPFHTARAAHTLLLAAWLSCAFGGVLLAASPRPRPYADRVVPWLVYALFAAVAVAITGFHLDRWRAGAFVESPWPLAGVHAVVVLSVVALTGRPAGFVPRLLRAGLATVGLAIVLGALRPGGDPAAWTAAVRDVLAGCAWPALGAASWAWLAGAAESRPVRRALAAAAVACPATLALGAGGLGWAAWGAFWAVAPRFVATAASPWLRESARFGLAGSIAGLVVGLWPSPSPLLAVAGTHVAVAFACGCPAVAAVGLVVAERGAAGLAAVARRAWFAGVGGMGAALLAAGGAEHAAGPSATYAETRLAAVPWLWCFVACAVAATVGIVALAAAALRPRGGAPGRASG